jgi:hypothetical protein
MSERDWKQEAQENLADFERRQKSIMHNPSLARRYIERGAAVGLVVVFTWYGSGLRGISEEGRNLFFLCSIVATMVASALVTVGVIALMNQSKQSTAAPVKKDEPPAIGW